MFEYIGRKLGDFSMWFGENLTNGTRKILLGDNYVPINEARKKYWETIKKDNNNNDDDDNLILDLLMEYPMLVLLFIILLIRR
jgi:hypothetical protein